MRDFKNFIKTKSKGELWEMMWAYAQSNPRLPLCVQISDKQKSNIIYNYAFKNR